MLDSSESRSKELNVLLVSDGLKKKKKEGTYNYIIFIPSGSKSFPKSRNSDLLKLLN